MVSLNQQTLHMQWKLSAIEIGRSMSKQYGHKVLNLMPTNLYGPNRLFF